MRIQHYRVAATGIALAVLASLASAETQMTEQIQSVPSLTEAFGARFLAGVAMDLRETTGTSANLLLHHFQSITPENHMKPEEIQPFEGVFSFDAADEVIAFAHENDLKVYGHTLVWHSQTADWMFQDAEGQPLTDSPEHQTLLLERMETHINAMAERYRDDVWAFDVVNEAIDETEADGYRKSPWFKVLGPDYIAYAFRFAREAFGQDVKLFINDYSTEMPSKREAYYKIVSGLVADGVPIDGVGHQLHIRLTTPISDIDASLTRFRDLGLVQAVTELDVALAATNDEVMTETPRDRLVKQGYFMKGLMEVFDVHADQIESIAVWGLHDGRTWLRYWPHERPFEAPLLFDENLAPKLAFWGLVDPSQLPHNPQGLTIPAMEVTVDGTVEAGWTSMPQVELAGKGGNAPTTGFQLRWSSDAIYLLAEISDASMGGGDGVEVFIDGFNYFLGRDGSAPIDVEAVAAETAHGYLIEAKLPAETASASAIFDLRVLDGAGGNTLSWSDQSHTQEKTITRHGILTLRDAIRSTDLHRAVTAPVIDGDVDAVWAEETLKTTVKVEGTEDGAKGDFQVLWDTEKIYVIATVIDGDLDSGGNSPWEHDSIEIFISPGNERAGSYLPRDGQYRISFENKVSVAGGPTISENNVESVATQIDGGYRIEAAIEVEGLAKGKFLGFELQVNDGQNGGRIAAHTWQDETGDSWRDTRNWGMAALRGQ